MTGRRKVAVVTGGRADWGLLRPILDVIVAEAGLELQLIACGTHLSSEYGGSFRQLEGEGFSPAATVDTLLTSDRPAAIAKAIGVGTVGFAQAYESLRPDLLVLLGDRFEMLAAAVAALPLNLPIAHIHGGEITEGAFDEQIRHALTKLSHLHFVATAEFQRRVLQMGEMPERVFVTGAPGLDGVRQLRRWTAAELAADLGIGFDPMPLLVTYHPTTLSLGGLGDDLDALFAALDDVGRPCIITYPNADTYSREVLARCQSFVAGHPRSILVAQLGSEKYFSVMARAAAMVGNSSSGLIEAASFALPVVNIGDRQKGRPRGANVLDVPGNREAIAGAILTAIDPGFRERLRGMANPYGDGDAAGRIVSVLRDHPLDDLARKQFHDMHVG
jgi:UDP-hydrolysing UDP-N-acetyl-D-glucosamine 2-epimerase